MSSRILRVTPLVAFASLVVLAGAARAAAPAATHAEPDTAVYALPLETVVDASRQDIPLRENPAATTVVGPGVLDRAVRGFSILDALTSVPGLKIDAPADAERVHLSIRGQGILAESGIRGITLLLDGVPLNDPTGVAPDAYDVDWSAVEKVEVLRGPAAALYTGGGSAGVVNIITRNGGSAPFTPYASVSGGSYGYRKTYAEAGGTSGALNYRVSLSQAAADGWRTHNAFWGDNAYAKLRWTPNSRVELQQVLAWTDYDEQNAEGLDAAQVQEDRRMPNPDAVPSNELFKTDRFTAAFNGRVTLAPKYTMKFSSWLRTSKYLEPRPDEIVDERFINPGASLQFDQESKLGGHKNVLSEGADVDYQSIDGFHRQNAGRARPDSLLAADNTMQRSAGVFVLDRLDLPHAVTAMACARYDYLYNKLTDLSMLASGDLTGRKSWERFTGRAGLAWAANTKFNLYANWGMGFLPPSTEELVTNPAAPGGFNQDLDAATSQGGEVGARGVLANWLSYELTGFLLDTDKDFDRYRLYDQPWQTGLTFYRNAGSSQRTGVESRALVRPLRNLEVEAAYTYSNFKYTKPSEIDGHWLPNSPEHMLSLDCDYRVLPRLLVGLGTQMESRWMLDTQNSLWVPGFSLWNARVTYDWTLAGYNGALTLEGRNIFGADYFAYTEPDPDGNSYQPGPKQEYYARVTFTH